MRKNCNYCFTTNGILVRLLILEECIAYSVCFYISKYLKKKKKLKKSKVKLDYKFGVAVSSGCKFGFRR